MSVVVMLMLAACVGDVGEGKVKAEVAEVRPEEPAGAAPAPAAPGTAHAVDPSRSSVQALGAKVTATTPITFHAFSGQVSIDGEAFTGLAIAVDVGSLDAQPAKLAAHLLKPDFLDVAQFPQATFASTAVAPGSDVAGMTHTVTGDLTIRGTARRLSFPAKVTLTPESVAAETEFTIDRQDFGVTFRGKPDDLVQDNVVLTISLVAPRA